MNRKRILAVILCASLLVAAVAVYELAVPKTGWIDGFKSGSAELNNRQIEKINELRQTLLESPDLSVAFKGSVSSEVIKGATCCVSDDGLNFSLGACANEGQTITGEQECENALGFARAKKVEAKLDLEDRVTVFQEVDFYRRPGDHSKNRAVSYWLVELPKDAELTDLHENTATGELIVSYTIKSCWKKFLEAMNIPPTSEWKFKSKTWEKYKSGDLFKSRIKERFEQRKEKEEEPEQKK